MSTIVADREIITLKSVEDQYAKESQALHDLSDFIKNHSDLKQFLTIGFGPDSEYETNNPSEKRETIIETISILADKLSFGRLNQLWELAYQLACEEVNFIPDKTED